MRVVGGIVAIDVTGRHAVGFELMCDLSAIVDRATRYGANPNGGADQLPDGVFRRRGVLRGRQDHHCSGHQSRKNSQRWPKTPSCLQPGSTSLHASKSFLTCHQTQQSTLVGVVLFNQSHGLEPHLPRARHSGELHSEAFFGQKNHHAHRQSGPILV